MDRNQKKNTKDPYPRHVKTWRFLYALASSYICRKFALTHEDLDIEGPVLLIPNHVTNWDPLLVAMSLKKKHVYFVATEHIFRLGFASKLLTYFLAPIARPKGGSGLETVRNCVEHLKKGHSICLFAEGEASWDGQTHPIFPATGKLVQLSGATLVTYRLEGAYLSLPRWRKTMRRGKVYGHPIRIYSPEELKKMTAREINQAIDRDIYENAWEREKTTGAVYRGKNPAEGLERGLYLCPKCRKIGTLKTAGDMIFCDCGLKRRYTEAGFADDAEPEGAGPEAGANASAVPFFPTFIEWDAWQKQTLQEMAAVQDPAHPFFSDSGLSLSRILPDHRSESLASGTLTLFPDRLELENCVFPVSEISSVAMVQANRLLFTFRNEYYEAFTDPSSRTNLRKYLDLLTASDT